jgi:copper chaperone CopZ
MDAQKVKFSMAEMTCGACVTRIRGALKQDGVPAKVEADRDLIQHLVRLTEGANPTTAKPVHEAIEAGRLSAAVANDSGPANRAVSGVGTARHGLRMR